MKGTLWAVCWHGGRWLAERVGLSGKFKLKGNALGGVPRYAPFVELRATARQVAVNDIQFQAA